MAEVEQESTGEETMNEVRPRWGFEKMSENEFRKIFEFGRIISVASKMRMTGVDRSNEWLEATNGEGQSITMPESWHVAFKFVGLWSTPGLFGLTHTGELMRDKLKEIDAFDKANAREREEYERLKRKFSPPD